MPKEIGILFNGQDLCHAEDADFASEAISALGLLNETSCSSLVAMLSEARVLGPEQVALEFRKQGTQISKERKKSLGIRRNSNFSEEAYSQLTVNGLKEPLRAHAATLTRAMFALLKAETVQLALANGFNELRISPSHFSDCRRCSVRGEEILQISKIGQLPPLDCTRFACSAWWQPYRDWLAEAK
ncbi:hypothetical protein [Gymnodinialimonas ulvae]|uniref:hypothetical protein n=1 Tax=Gymnodinialimonas ulvae TaxID=3126504 RepID=UPI0030B3BDC0